MTRRTWTITIVALAVLSLASLGSLTLARADAERADCPGKIVCPLTGELICRDLCPLEAKESEAPKADAKPACCSAKQRPAAE